MARVLLVMPRLPSRMGAPYLGQLSVAASLLAAGHEVRAIDLSAPRRAGGDDALVADVARFGPDLLGMTLFTWSAARGYALARRLAGVARALVAGGPHATVCPDEPLAHGFDAVVTGEGERAVVALAAALDAGTPLHAVPGVRTRDGRGPAAGPLDDLDALPWPHLGYAAFDLADYAPAGVDVAPGGTMTSRGCPARCTFCANYVTGRAYRFRSPGDVVRELVDLRRRHGLTHFPFWDDAFTALRPRLRALCDALLAEPDLEGVTWSCITPGNMVKPHDLAHMRAAGCVAVNFGLESGDAGVLRAIQKGQRPEQVRAAVQAAKAEGMTTVVNFMFGFPGEGVDALGRTLAFMDAIAPWTDYFNQRGVLVPFPGTALYDEHARAYGLEGWWLDPANAPLDPDHDDPWETLAWQAHDPTLDLDFFRYDAAVRDAIAACVAYKADHNRRTVERLCAGALPGLAGAAPRVPPPAAEAP